MPNTVILIPAYKPTDALTILCETLSSRGYPIVCVDDGSGSAFDSVFEKAAAYAEVLRYPVNKGKGGALKFGLSHIASDKRYSSYCSVVTADADGQHRPDDIDKTAAASEKEDALVLGVRRFTGKVPLRSRFGNSLTRLVFALASGKKVCDTQTGLRGMRIKDLSLYREVPGDKYEYEMNVLFAAVYANIPFCEVPIETVYENNNEGSHFHPIRDSVRIYKAIFRARSMKKSMMKYIKKDPAV